MTQTTPLPPGLDPNYVFSEAMPLIATVTVILAVAIALRWVFRSPVGEALAQRIRAGIRSQTTGPASGQARADVEDRLAQLQEQVGDLTERLDFAERVLAEQRKRVVPGS
jgi:hypothetical protein